MPADLPMTMDELIAAERRGRRLKYLYFWGHQPAGDGGVGKGCLSQWWPVRFTADGHTFASAEHYMMAHKAWLFGDEENAARVLAVRHPKQAKELGRAVRGFDQATWEKHRFDIVVRGNVAKFGGHEELAGYLLGTGTRILVEASPVDRVWGIGLAADDDRAASPQRWQGLNLLGFALMAARAALEDGKRG
ncbi:NADAR family protein [Nonomuraea sp. PA05]|uniref:NADAR family protein n=1 Tax=Nonomuraea sp. PA05 TaxID=2604466 RepID=UPI0011DAC531|nr:NADAR family protein [Nonomuraea sp. PA05]TYB65436.1 NADAR family protein [Nonomuraea sp. PA05]